MHKYTIKLKFETCSWSMCHLIKPGQMKFVQTIKNNAQSPPTYSYVLLQGTYKNKSICTHIYKHTSCTYILTHMLWAVCVLIKCIY